MGRRKVLIACDDTPHSRAMVDVAFGQTAGSSSIIHRTTDEVHLATVRPMPMPAASAYPPAPFTTSAAAVVAIHHQASQESVRRQELERGKETLRHVADLLAADFHVPRASIRLHVLTSSAESGGVSDALLQLACTIRADLLVIGSRGLGALRRSLGSLVGLGSVSDAVLRAAPCPVLLVRACNPASMAKHVHVEAEPPPPVVPSKRVIVGVDESPRARDALLWALDHVLAPHDQLHIVGVSNGGQPAVVLDEPAAVAAMQAQAVADSREAAMAAARRDVDNAVDLAVSHGVTRTKIIGVALPPGGGTSEVGAALAAYAADKAADVVVVGSRGLGAIQAGFMGFLGLGSVSQYLAHTLHQGCALAVVRGERGADARRSSGDTTSVSSDPENLPFHVIQETDESEAAV